ncbi:hypothetical protein ABPG75_011950 [Micractinium tetrahymenae]
MDPPITGPSQVPIIGPLLDAFFLWMATKHCFLLFALATMRPPLYLAVPLQAVGVWRANRAGFCTSAVLSHPVMQRRTALAHAVMGFAYEAALGQPLSFASGHHDPQLRCRSLYLFCSLIVSLLLPLLLLITLHKQSNGSGSQGSTAAPATHSAEELSGSARLELWLQGRLKPLLWLPDSRPNGAAQRQGQQGQQEQQALVPRGLVLVLLRWSLLALALWAASCLAVEGL